MIFRRSVPTIVSARVTEAGGITGRNRSARLQRSWKLACRVAETGDDVREGKRTRERERAKVSMTVRQTTAAPGKAMATDTIGRRLINQTGVGFGAELRPAAIHPALCRLLEGRLPGRHGLDSSSFYLCGLLDRSL